MKLTTEQRFWSKVDKYGPTSDESLGNCWEWVGAVDSNGGGLLWDGSRNISAHRYIYQKTFGEELRTDQRLYSRCRNSRCVRPSHWFRRDDIAEIAIRFWLKVRVADEDDPDSCWLWTDYLNSDGRGRFHFNPVGRMELAHRVAWRIVYGEWPECLLMHRCDTPSCVRLDHLEEGTAAQNIRDAVTRGRLFRKLDVEKAHSIKQEYVPGT
jgi:hypothetical protein